MARKVARDTHSATASKERDRREKVTVRQAVFAYDDEMGVHRRARRGAVIYVTDADYERGMQGGAFKEGFTGNQIGIMTPQMYAKGQPATQEQAAIAASPLPVQIDVLKQQVAQLEAQHRAEEAERLDPQTTGPVGTTEGGLAEGVSMPTRADGTVIGGKSDVELESEIEGMNDEELEKFVTSSSVQAITDELVTMEDADRVLAMEERTTNNDPRKTLVTAIEAHKTALLARAENDDPNREPDDLGGPTDPDPNEGQG
jgi:hypothetical protein